MGGRKKILYTGRYNCASRFSNILEIRFCRELSYPFVYLLSASVAVVFVVRVLCPFFRLLPPVIHTVKFCGTGSSAPNVLSLSPVAFPLRSIQPLRAFCYCCRACTISSIFIPREPFTNTTSPSCSIERRASVHSLLDA